MVAMFGEVAPPLKRRLMGWWANVVPALAQRWLNAGPSFSLAFPDMRRLVEALVSPPQV